MSDGHHAACQGFGILESVGAADAESVASWCFCDAAREARFSLGEDYVERVNRARERLRQLRTKPVGWQLRGPGWKRLEQTIGQVQGGDDGYKDADVKGT